MIDDPVMKAMAEMAAEKSLEAQRPGSAPDAAQPASPPDLVATGLVKRYGVDPDERTSDE